MENQRVGNTGVEKKGNTTNKLLIVVILLLFCFCGYLIWQNLELQKLLESGEIAYNEVSNERDQVKEFKPERKVSVDYIDIAGVYLCNFFEYSCG